MRRGYIQRRFGLSCILQLYFLRKSTEFHFLQTECQRILIHFLPLIYHKSPAIAKRCPLPIFHIPVFAPKSLPNISPIYPQSLVGIIVLQFTLQFLIILSGWIFRTVFLSLDWLSCAVELVTCLRGCKLEHHFKVRIIAKSQLWTWSQLQMVLCTLIKLGGRHLMIKRMVICLSNHNLSPFSMKVVLVLLLKLKDLKWTKAKKYHWHHNLFGNPYSLHQHR